MREDMLPIFLLACKQNFGGLFIYGVVAVLTSWTKIPRLRSRGNFAHSLILCLRPANLDRYAAHEQ
jgi:hypothetical protein